MLSDEEYEKRLQEVRKRMKKEGEEVKQRSRECPVEEPTGKMTNPSDLDRIRDRKHDD
ncbi:hypothetical protein [Endozoicomonas numazuensis]|uniref:hypothetical protein n=1 Tax=Endozoicomonas numazuensis TaxID=1137799 RepID=UPI001378473B|nr:hypothetical protein [Endozoicomonas numazuensis]